MTASGPGFGANLARRVATALVALPLLLAALFLGPPHLFAAVALSAVALGIHEFFGLVAARGLAPLRLAGFTTALLVFLQVAVPRALPFTLWPGLALLVLTALLMRGGDVAASVPAAAATLLGCVYLGALGGSIAGLRLLPPVAGGSWRVLLLFGVVMAADSLAYFVGHAVGRHKLAPLISPGKTVEGFVGGLAGGVAGALAICSIGLTEVPRAHAAVLGLGVATLGSVGDLVESALKRWAAVKDSGALFPGHGGMLDRLDSLLFGAPVLYYYFALLR